MTSAARHRRLRRLQRAYRAEATRYVAPPRGPSVNDPADLRLDPVAVASAFLAARVALAAFEE